MNLKQEIENYQPTEFKSISDIESINVDIELHQKEATTKEGKLFTYKYFIDADGTEVRIPLQVIAQLKEHLQANPAMTRFKVRKTGEGLKTQYTVIPLV